MAEDLEVDAWELYDAIETLKTDEIEELKVNKIDMPKCVQRWKEVVGQFSLHNDYPATMSYYVTLGQIVKDVVRIPVGRLSLDPRIQFCWIQTARSGKTTMFDFLSPVWDKTFDLVNQHPTTLQKPKGPLYGVNEFNLQNPDAFTDQALLGTIKKNQINPDWIRGEDNLDVNGDLIPEFIDITVNGALFGSGIIAFDEFEHSGIFKDTQHKQDTVMMFQKFMNRLDSDTHLIKKRLTDWGIDLVVDSQRSLWATTLPPQGLENVILTKGVFQRMWLYVREVPESLKRKMEEDYLDLMGTIVEDDDGAEKFQDEFAEMLYTNYKWCLKRLAKVGDRRKIVEFSPDAKQRLKIIWRGMRKYMDGFPDHIHHALNTFLMNIINNMCVSAALCAISEQSPKILPRHIEQGRRLTDNSFDSITTWFSDRLAKSPRRLVEKNREKIVITSYKECPLSNGWTSKTNVISTYMKKTQKSRNTFYRLWHDVEHMFETKRSDNNKVLIRLKVEKNESKNKKD
tara:strand:+ start:2233 stop:3768 length:1536 start_codon:yes stop_codon:yes gene_type:complete